MATWRHVKGRRVKGLSPFFTAPLTVRLPRGEGWGLIRIRGLPATCRLIMHALIARQDRACAPTVGALFLPLDMLVLLFPGDVAVQLLLCIVCGLCCFDVDGRRLQCCATCFLWVYCVYCMYMHVHHATLLGMSWVTFAAVRTLESAAATPVCTAYYGSTFSGL
jgi:hypothetical protein